MGNAERRLQRARERAEMPTNDPTIATRRLQQLAATLPSARPGVTSDVEASKKHARALSRELKLDKGATYDLVLAAELHEVGKATIDRDALYAPGELDAETRAIVEAHAANAAGLAAAIERPQVVAALAMQNERHDGTGPSGIPGENLPVLAQSLSVISAYVAMTSKRPYRPALSREHALEVLSTEAGRQFDAGIVEAFIRTIPQKKLAVAAADVGASIARPIRGMQLAYRRHGRVATAVVSSFSAAAVLIGASTLAPGGIGQAIERMGWPTQNGQESSPESSALAAADNGDATVASGTAVGSDDAVTGTLGGIAENFASGTADGTTTEVTQIQSGYSYEADNDDFEEDPDGDTTTAGDGGSTTDSTDDDNDSTDDDEKPSDSDDDGNDDDDSDSDDDGTEESNEKEKEEKNKPDKAKGHGTDDDAADEPEPSESPSPDDPDDYKSSPAPEETDGKGDEEDRGSGSDKSDKFKAYQSEEQDDDTDDVETSDSETDEVGTEEDPAEPVEEEAVVAEEPAPTAPRDGTPTWGSLH